MSPRQACLNCLNHDTPALLEAALWMSAEHDPLLQPGEVLQRFNDLQQQVSAGLPCLPASELAQPLVRRLLAYEQMKLAALALDALPRAGRDFAWAWLPLEISATATPPQVQVADLSQAWLAILARASHHRHHYRSQAQLARTALAAPVFHVARTP